MKSDTTPIPAGDLEQRLGAHFRKLRKERKFSLVALAAAMKCSVNTIRWHEAGARLMRFDDVVRAAEVIGVAPDRLLPTNPEATKEHSNGVSQ